MDVDLFGINLTKGENYEQKRQRARIGFDTCRSPKEERASDISIK